MKISLVYAAQQQKKVEKSNHVMLVVVKTEVINLNLKFSSFPTPFDAITH